MTMDIDAEVIGRWPNIAAAPFQAKRPDAQESPETVRCEHEPAETANTTAESKPAALDAGFRGGMTNLERLFRESAEFRDTVEGHLCVFDLHYRGVTGRGFADSFEAERWLLDGGYDETANDLRRSIAGLKETVERQREEIEHRKHVMQVQANSFLGLEREIAALRGRCAGLEGLARDLHAQLLNAYDAKELDGFAARMRELGVEP